MLKAIWSCVNGSEGSGSGSHFAGTTSTHEGYYPPPESKADMMADDIFNAVQSAKQVGDQLRGQVEKIAPASYWTDRLAQLVLARLEEGVRKVVLEGVQIGGALKEAFDKAVVAAVGFARDHPAYCTLIALGILAVLFPYMLELLGFAELGPVEGSFAASWQSRYLGYVPKNSLFSYFQRLGMIWKHSVGLESLVVYGSAGTMSKL
ncbi:hypothetical protein A1O3_00411 [Capronia epimyces CBS 606.96]|uniref:Uncharacterized protein n=1 Tax=Capronia epimyces CBS 606.96 TaxID=1182542 RepID=W9YRL1_9EURO|nr:uncharacterized protein A1O3_00411 [Capronia epimyces CBS 606.96]EXJ91861.1 hypothetical protein A1O3_00411 [Capronia epimyces CBS 606.96]